MITDIGNHRTRNGSIMGGIGDLLGNSGVEQADVFYSAPLHGDGIERNVKAREASLDMTGNPNQVPTIDDILHKFFEIARLYTHNYAPIFVEYHKDREAEIMRAGYAWGVHRWATVDCKDTMPTQLHIFTRGNLKVPEGLVADLSGKVGVARIKAATRFWARPRGILLDPCCGIGLTAQAAVEMGMFFRGNEPSAVKLGQTHEVLHGQGAEDAKAQKAVPRVQKKTDR